MSSKIAEARAALTELADWSALTLTPDDFTIHDVKGQTFFILYLTSDPEQGPVGMIHIQPWEQGKARLFFEDFIRENYYVES